MGMNIDWWLVSVYIELAIPPLIMISIMVIPAWLINRLMNTMHNLGKIELEKQQKAKEAAILARKQYQNMIDIREASKRQLRELEE